MHIRQNISWVCLTWDHDYISFAQDTRHMKNCRNIDHLDGVLDAWAEQYDGWNEDTQEHEPDPEDNAMESAEQEIPLRLS